jgi:hypothetical protein
MATKYSQDDEAAVGKIMSKYSSAEAAKMFGFPAYKVNGKMAVRLHEEGVLVKVGRDKAESLISAGTAKKFEPLPDRPWRDWVLLTSNIEGHADLFKQAVDVVTKETS